jgi:hypothetical protein
MALDEITLRIRASVEVAQELAPPSAPPSTPPSTLLVVMSHDEYVITSRRLKGHPDFFVTYPGMGLQGRRFKVILYPDRWLGVAVGPQARMREDWWDNQVRCRLTVDGVMVAI